MKKFIILASAVLGLGIATSCNKQLDITPPNAFTDEQISDLMLNGDDATKEKILGQIASGLQQYFNYWNIPNVGTGALAPTTYCMQGIEWARGLQGNDIAIGRDASTNSLAGKSFYENTFNFAGSNQPSNKAHWYVNALIIGKANFILGYMTKEMAAANPTYAAARAGALMIRAYGYMCLLEEYTPAYAAIADVNAANSGLPLYDTYAPGQAPVARSSAKDCWDFVKADLVEAASLAETAVGYTVGWDKSEDLDAGLANFLLARAYILTCEWDKAIAACDKVIISGAYSFINKANWGGQNTGADWTGANVEIFPETNAFTAIKVNPEVILGYNSKSSFNPYTEAGGLAAHFTRLANPFGSYASSTCARIDDRLYNKIDANDCRKDAWYPNEIVDFRYMGQTAAIVASYSAIKFACTYGLNDIDGAGHTTVDNVGLNDFTKFRYSEVVLMKAEAQAQKGVSPASTLDPLLAARAKTGSLSYATYNWPADCTTDLQKVQLQYRIEMWGENGREYYNNKRWGISVNRAGSTVHASNPTAAAVTIAPEKMVCEIIEEEVQNNPNL